MLRINIYIVIACIVLAGKLSAQSFISVTNTQDSGPGSLRSAIFAANNSTDSPAIIFSIPAESIIQLQSRLPDLNKSEVIIDGSSASGFAYPNNMITLNWSGAEDCIRLQNDNIIIKGLTFTNSGNGNGDAAIRVMSGNNTVVEYCRSYNQNKSFVAANGGNGIKVNQCTIEDFVNQGGATVFRCNGGGFDLISNCDISDIPGKVFELNSSIAEVTTFRNNTLTNVGFKDNGAAGGYDAHLIDVNYANTRMVIRDNRVSGCKSKFVDIVRGSGIVIRQDSIFNNMVLNCTGQHVIFISGQASSNPYIGFNYFDGDGGIYNQDQVIELHYAKYGRIWGNVIKNAKARGIMCRDSDITLIRNNIMYNLSGNHAIELNDDCDQMVIRGNILGTDSLNTPGLSLFTSDVIAFNDCDDCIIGGKRDNQGNQIIQSNSGRAVGLSSSCEGTTLIQGNDFNVSTDGLTCLTDSDKYVIEVSGSTLHFGGDFELYHNRVAGKGNYGLFVKTPNSLIEGNLIGCTELGLPIAGNNMQIAIMAWEGNMTIGSKANPELRNKFGYNTMAVYNSGEVNVCWSGNEYIQNTGNATGEVLVGGIEPPVITGGTMPSTAIGTARPNARVEVYLWDPATAVQGYQYLGHVVADGGGNWIFTNNEPFGNQIAALQIDGLDASGFASYNGFDIFPPTANHDYSENNVVGSVATINILDNDTLYNGAPATPANTAVDIDPATGGTQIELIVDGEGTWSYDAALGILAFEPETGFTSDPSHIQYKLTETSTGFFDLAVVVVDYLEVPPLSADDESHGNPAGEVVTVNILSNDQMSDGSAVIPERVSVDINTSVIGIQTVKIIPDKGIWTYNETTGNLTFQPFAGTYTTEPIEYRLIEKATGLDDQAMVTITYMIFPPEAADDISENNYFGAGASINILSNDILLDGSTAAPHLVTIDLDQSVAGNQSLLFVEGEGSWTYSSITGNLFFMPEIGFYGNPTPVVYTLTENGTGLSDDATVTVTYVQGANISPPENLSAGVFNTNSVLLSWDPPSFSGGAFISWDDGTNYEGIGLTDGGTFSVAARWIPEQLENYDGFSLTNIRFFPKGFTPVTITLKVWSGVNASNLLVSQPLTNIVMNQWNLILLDLPVPININEELWVGYTITDQPIGVFPAGCDNGPAVKGFGDKISLDGTTWGNLKDYGFDYNWNVQAILEVAEGLALAVQPPNQNNTAYQNLSNDLSKSKQPSMETIQSKVFPIITGYQVFKDGEFLDILGAEETNYIDIDLPDGIYAYQVSTVFDVGVSFPCDPAEVSIPGGMGPEIVIDPMMIDEVHPDAPEVTTMQVAVTNTGSAVLNLNLEIAPLPSVKTTIDQHHDLISIKPTATPIKTESLPWLAVKLEPSLVAPSTKGEVVIRYDDGENHGAIGIDDPTVTFEAAAYFPASTMVNYTGMVLTQMQVFFWDTPYFLKIKVYGQGTSSEPGALIYEQQIGSGITNNSWTTFTLGEGVLVTGEDLWIGYEVGQSSASEFPAGFDEGPAVTGFGDMNKLNGVWATMSSYGFDFNWNIAGILVDETGLTNWLSALPMEESIFPNETRNIELTFNSEGLPLGIYEALLKFNSNDTNNPSVEVPVSLNVGDISLPPPTGLMATVTDNDVLLSWTMPVGKHTKDLLGYKIYRDFVFLDHVTTTAYLDENLISGAYSYYVTAIYSFGQSEPSNTAEVIVLPSSSDPTLVVSPEQIMEIHYYPPEISTLPIVLTNEGEIDLVFNLEIEIQSKRAPSNYNLYNDEHFEVFPARFVEEIIRYDNGENSSSVGIFGGGTIETSVYFPAAFMAQYEGWYLDKVEFYINRKPVECKVHIYGQGTSSNPGELIYEQEVSVSQNSWNLIDFQFPILLDGNDLWVGYSALHNGGQPPCGTDAGPAVTGFGDWIRVDGQDWWNLGGAGIDRNWNLAGYVTDIPVINWLEADLTADTLQQNESRVINLMFNSNMLFEGIHQASLIFNSNDPSNPQVIIPVVLDVGGGSLNPPENLSAEVTNSDVTLTWDAPINKMLMGYNIYRDEVKINPAPVTQTTYFDPGVAPGTHLYNATALYSYGESAKTDPVEVFIDGDVGKIHGFVRDAVTNLAIEKAIITATNAENGVMTFNTPFGAYYSLLLPAGNYDVTCKSEGYESFTLDNVTVIENMNKAYTFYLQPSTDLLTGLDHEGNDQLRIYPNPAREQIVVTGEDILKIEIVSQTGMVMQEFEGRSGKQTIDIRRLPVGVYLIRITTKNAVITEKLIIR